MDKSAVPGERERRKHVRVRLRRNLVFSAQQGDGTVGYVLKDPVSLRYFRLDTKQHFLARLMDGTHTLDEIRRAFEKQHRPERLTLEELETFSAQLVGSGLAHNDAPGAGPLLFEKAQKQRREARWSAALNFLAIRVPLCNPDRFLTRLVLWVRFAFTLPFLLLGAGLMLAALALLATHWGDFLARLPEAREFFSLKNLLCLWVALGLVKVLHELGHGLCCKAFGGTVHEAGLLLLIFFPTLYCNVSDSWSIPQRRRRLAVSGAGIFVELLVAAAATFAWWATDPASFVHQLCLSLMVVCGVNTVLFNANPLMRFDGYYMLSDWLEVPNLSDTAGRQLRAGVLRWLGADVREPAIAWPRFLVFYAGASYVYRCLVAVWCFHLLSTFLVPYKLGSVGYLLALAGVAVMLGWPLCRLLKAVHGRGRLPDMKPVRVWLAVGALAALVAVVVAVPFPVRVQGVALVQVEPEQVQRVVVPERGGLLRDVMVHDGQRVRAGDILAVLANSELEIKLRVNEADQSLRQKQKAAQLATLTEVGAGEGPALVSLQQTEFELRALAREHAILREQLDRLVLRAPCDGTVMGLVPVDDKGKWLENGAEVCRVGNDRVLRAVLLVEPADHELVTAGGRAWIRVHGGGAKHWPGVVTEIAQVDAGSIPPALSRRAGGDVMTKQDPVSKAEKPYHPHYLSSVRFQRVDACVHPGALGRVKIEAGSRTLWWRFQRYLSSTFNWQL
jgi:putative peptide zinc metalloprotease protein